MDSKKLRLKLWTGADPNVNAGKTSGTGKTSGSPLFCACSCGHGESTFPDPGLASKWREGEEVELAQLLLLAKADPKLHVNTSGGDGSPLSRLAELGVAPRLVQILVDAGADVEDRCGDEKEGLFTPLIIAAKTMGGPGHCKTLIEMISAGADVNARRTVSGLTALHAACESNNPAVVWAMIAAGADLEMRKLSGSKQTALLISSGSSRVALFCESFVSFVSLL